MLGVSRSGKEKTEGQGKKWLYGTFQAQSPTGWMLELNRYLGDFQTLVWIYILCSILLSIVWPVSWIVGLITGAIAQSKKKEFLYAITFQCFFATGLGLAICCVPAAVVWMWPGGFEDLYDRVERRELASNDVQSPWKAQMFLMLLYYFCVIYQDVNEQIVEVKKWVVPYLKNAVSSLDIVPEQRERVNKFLEEENLQSEGDLCDLLQVLETMPGWGSPAEGDVQEGQGFFQLIKNSRESAHSKGLFGLDIYTLRQMKYNIREGCQSEAAEPRNLNDALMEEWETAKTRCLTTITYVLGYLMENKLSLALVVFLALVRVSIPRLWLGYYLGGMVYPHDFWPAFFVFTSVVTSFATYFLFMALFLVMVFEYESNAQQLYLLTALINMDARCHYCERVLVYAEKMEPEESEKLMSRIPILNLTSSRNAIGFWNLRDYVMLDRANDRVGMQILISISILLTLFNVVLATYDLLTLPFISAFVPIVIFDVLVVGCLILYCLQQALYMNMWTKSHVKHFNRAIHDIMSTHAGIVLDNENVPSEKAKKDLIEDLTLAKKFLRSSIAMVQENDPVEALLFGAEVTPASIASSAGGFLATLGFMIYKILKAGKNPVDNIAPAAFHNTKFLMKAAVRMLF